MSSLLTAMKFFLISIYSLFSIYIFYLFSFPSSPLRKGEVFRRVFSAVSGTFPHITLSLRSHALFTPPVYFFHVRPSLSSATAQVFFHRFYVAFDILNAHFDPHIVAVACSFLAGKVEESPKKLRQVLS